MPLTLILLLLAQDQQIGARTKAMGGSYTAFEDDPVSVWLNPAGIATQPDALSVTYQSYTLYELEFSPPSTFDVPAETGWSDPPIIPSYLGLVFQLGHGETDHAIGICFAAPFRNRYVVINTDLVVSQFDQAFYRFRVAYAYDLRFKPKGETGFLTHLSFGLGLDLSVTSWRADGIFGFNPFTDEISVGFNDTGFGGGAGLLLGLYDNASTLRVNFGIAYQSRVNYKFSISQSVVPTSDWPNQVNTGFTLYLLDGLPLRVTLDMQWIGWDLSTHDSDIAGFDDFDDVFNYSLGVEYRFKVSDNVRIFPRAGVRIHQSPWTDEDNPPAIGNQTLLIEPRNNRYLIGSVGVGVGWTTAGGKQRMVDVAFDFGADAPGFAFGFTMEF